jgi:excisionase family DNA binding protein
LSDLLTLKEVKDILKVGQNKVYEMAQTKQIPVVKIGNKGYRVPRHALEKWIEEQTKVNM